MEPLPQPSKTALLSVINRYFGTCSAYGISACQVTSAGQDQTSSSNNQRLIVMVFSKTVLPERAREAAAAWSQQAGGIEILFLVHRLTDLGTHDVGMQGFFRAVLQQGERLCLDTAHVPYLAATEVSEADPRGVREFWHKCQAVTDYYFEAAGSGRLDVELIKIAMLHTAVEQTCLGLIRLLSGYVPNTHSLRFLLELCGQFTPLPYECFPQQGEANLRRFKRLCAPPSMLRHWVRLEAPEADFLILYENTREFLKQAARLADLKLEKRYANPQTP